MPLITSISGIRGTIGGREGHGLTPGDIVKYTSAYAQWVKADSRKSRPKLIIGRMPGYPV